MSTEISSQVIKELSEQPFMAVYAKTEDLFLDECQQKQIKIIWQQERLFVINKTSQLILFAQVIWQCGEVVSFESIKEASLALKKRLGLWYYYPLVSIRRGSLIAEKLIPIKKKKLSYLGKAPQGNLGCYSLLDDHHLLMLTEANHSLPLGQAEFDEDKEGPPSRAYLKLWELFTLYYQVPQANEKVIDLGSSPGGWTWVLAQLGCEVISVDKANLASNVSKMSQVKFLKQSAYALDPHNFKDCQWVFSDIIAYPDALYQLIKKWLEVLPHCHFVWTIKLQGQTDFKYLEMLKAIPNAQLIHLYQNKHEVTWVRPAPKGNCSN